MGKCAVSRYFIEAHVKNKISICGINVLNHLNFGFRILWCELRCARLVVPVEKKTRSKRELDKGCWTKGVRHFQNFSLPQNIFFDHSHFRMRKEERMDAR
jgi:hypothetical protein